MWTLQEVQKGPPDDPYTSYRDVWVPFSGFQVGVLGARYTQYSPFAFEQALSDCISQLYPMFAMTSFIPTTAPDSTGSDRFNGAIGIRDVLTGGEAKIVNDPSPPATIRDDMISKDERGRTYLNNPWWNYSISASQAPDFRPGELRYPELYLEPGMPFVRTQIHELGAALTIIRNKYHPAHYAPLDKSLDLATPMMVLQWKIASGGNTTRGWV